MWGEKHLGHVTRDRARKPLGQSGGELGPVHLFLFAAAAPI
jgi:hypothetical protein